MTDKKALVVHPVSMGDAHPFDKLIKEMLLENTMVRRSDFMVGAGFAENEIDAVCEASLYVVMDRDVADAIQVFIDAHLQSDKSKEAERN